MKSIMFSTAMVLAAPLAMLVAAQAANANIIVNGDFSANASSYVVYPGNDGKSSTAGTNPASPTGWAGSTNDGVQGTDVGFTPKTPFAPSSLGTVVDYAFIHFQSSLYQSFTVTPGATYTVSFMAASQSGQAAPTLTAYALDGTTTSKTNPLASKSPTLSSTSFDPVSFNFTAGTASTDTLLFATSTNNDAADITDVSIAPVPEPAAMGLFGVGAVGLLLARRRKA